MEINSYLTAEEVKILQSAQVGIAGGGGLGSNAAMHLVRSGIGHLVIADFDVVSPGNLNRQFFFFDQIGLKKVDALRENLLKINPDAKITALDMLINEENVASIFAECPIVIEAFDRAETKSMFIGAMLNAGKIVVTVSGLGGCGRSNELRVRKIGESLYMIGDCRSGVEIAPPFSPRVGIAAAMEANTVMALLLNMPV